MSLTYTEQLLEIAQSPYYEAVTVDTLKELQAKALLERSGFTVTSEGFVLRTGSIIGSSGEAVTANAIVNPTVTTDLVAGTQTVSAEALPAVTTESGLNVVSGGVTPAVAATQFVGAALIGAHIGYKSYQEYPEFWTDLSNTIFETDLNNPSVLPTSMFLTRVLADGGVKMYCEKKRLADMYTKMWDSGIFDPDGSVTPTHAYGGTYVLNQKPHTDGVADAFRLIKQVAGYTASDDQIRYISENVLDKTCGSLAIFMARVDNNPVYKVCMWNELPEAVNVVKTDEGRYVNKPSTQTVKYVWQIYSTGAYGFPQRVQSDTLLNGSMDGWKVIYSDCDAEYNPSYESLIYDDNYNYPASLAALLALLDEKSADGFTVNRINEDGDIEPVEFVPLSTDGISTDDTTTPDNSKQDKVNSGDVPDEDGKLPPWFSDLFTPGITVPPSIPSFPEYSNGVTPPFIPPVNNFSSKLYTVYHPTDTILDNLGGYLWSTNIVTEIQKLFTNNPMDAIISLHQIYKTPSSPSSKHIVLGSLNSGISCPVVTQQYIELDCGSVYIPEIYGDARDYIDTDCQVFLPFISYRSIDPHDVVNCSVNIKYTIDVYTGSCLAQLFVTKDGVQQCLYTFEGNCSVQIPLTASQRTGIMGLITSGAMALGGALTGNAAMAATGATQFAGGIVGGQAKNSIQRTSGFSGNAGAMGIKKPFIILTRYKSADAVNYEHFVGNPTNRTTILGNCKGYTRVKSIHVEDIPGATDREKDMIRSLLMEGVII